MWQFWNGPWVRSLLWFLSIAHKKGTRKPEGLSYTSHVGPCPPLWGCRWCSLLLPQRAPIWQNHECLNKQCGNIGGVCHDSIQNLGKKGKNNFFWQYRYKFWMKWKLIFFRRKPPCYHSTPCVTQGTSGIAWYARKQLSVSTQHSFLLWLWPQFKPVAWRHFRMNFPLARPWAPKVKSHHCWLRQELFRFLNITLRKAIL